MDKNQRKVFRTTEITGVGIVGYNVQFSLKDLYALRALADNAKAQDIESINMLAEAITKLCNKTIEKFETEHFDFLSDNEAK